MNRRVAADPTLIVNRDRGVRQSARLKVLGVILVTAVAATAVVTPVAAATKGATRTAKRHGGASLRAVREEWIRQTGIQGDGVG